MNFAPYTWRADGGYIPPEDSIPYILPPPRPTLCPISPPQHPQTYIQAGPIAVQSVWGPPPTPCPPSSSAAAAATVGAAAAVLPLHPGPPHPPHPVPAPQLSFKPHPPISKPPAPRPATASNPYSPPLLRPGTNYLFPPSHTTLHIFNKASKLWLPKYSSQSSSLKFKIFKVGTNFKLKEVISRVLGPGVEGKGWAISELHEGGDGKWLLGFTVEYDSPRAEERLESVGWGAKRGREVGPVWVSVHRV